MATMIYDKNTQAAARSKASDTAMLPGNGNALAQAGQKLPIDPADQEMIISVEGDTLRVRGDIDLYQAARFRQQAEAFINNTIGPRFDLTAVPFIDSAGLAALLALSRAAKAQGKALRLSITGSPRRVLRITGIDKLLAIED